jgi:hypothetical protein
MVLTYLVHHTHILSTVLTAHDTKLATAANLATANNSHHHRHHHHHRQRPRHQLPSLVDCCFSPLPWWGGGLGPSFAPPIQKTCPRPTLPGLWSCYHCNGYPSAHEQQIFAITRAWDVHKWGSTGEGWEGGMLSFGAISVTSAMVTRVIRRVRECFCCRVYVKSGTNV